MRHVTFIAPLLTGLVMACSQGSSPPAGSMGDTDSSGETTTAPPVSSIPENCDAPAPGVAPLRRLSNFEYQNTLSDLLSPEVAVQVTGQLVREPTSLGFRNSAQLEQRINAISLADVRRAAQKYLRPEAAALAVIDPQ